jgi:putative phage-type endonuclease
MNRNLKFVYHHELPRPTPARQKYLREQVQRLMQIPQPEQRTPEWYRMRESMVTASDFGSIFGDCAYKDRESVLLNKVEPNQKFFKSPAMMFGTKYEEVANMIYQKRNGVKVIEFGCIRHHTFSFFGASPDGITPDGVMLEIKCPTSRVITGEPPKYYYHQMQGQLEVAELDRCDFLECKLIEYTEVEYLEDNYEGDYACHSNSMEKGLVAEIFDSKDNSTSYEYSPIGIMGDEYMIWKSVVERQYEGHPTKFVSTYTYWYLDEVSCVPVYRNQEWLYQYVPVLREFWDDVLKYRRLGVEACKEYIKNLRERKKMEKALEKEEKKAFTQQSQKKGQDRDMTDFYMVESVTTKEKKEEKKVEKKKVSKRKKDEDDMEDEIPSGCLFGNDEFHSHTQIIYDSDENYEVDVGVFAFQEEEKKEEVIEKKTTKKILKNPLCLFS